MKKINVKRLAVTSLLIAMEIVLTRFFSVQTPIVRISFGFLPIAVLGMLYGPVYAGIGASLADFIGATVFPAGAFFPGFTLTAFLTGVVYGLCLYNRKINPAHICVAVIIVNIALNLGLDTIWLQIITGKGYLALLPARILKCVIMAPIQILSIRLIAGEFLFKLKASTLV